MLKSVFKYYLHGDILVVMVTSFGIGPYGLGGGAPPPKQMDQLEKY